MFEEEDHWTRDDAQRIISSVGELWGWSLREMTQPLYVALTGSRTSLPLFESIVILGKDVVRRRVLAAVLALGDLSSKKLDALRKTWDQKRAAAGAKVDKPGGEG